MKLTYVPVFSNLYAIVGCVNGTLNYSESLPIMSPRYGKTEHLELKNLNYFTHPTINSHFSWCVGEIVRYRNPTVPCFHFTSTLLTLTETVFPLVQILNKLYNYITQCILFDTQHSV